MAILPRQGQRWLAGMVMLTLSGCAYIPHKPLVDGATTAQPAPASAPMPNGSIFQTVQPMNYGYQPLFEDRRPRNVGDTLTIVLQENVSASKKLLRQRQPQRRQQVRRRHLAALPRRPVGQCARRYGHFRRQHLRRQGRRQRQQHLQRHHYGDGQPGAGQWQPARGRGKQIAINQGTEFIRFSGVVNPRTISGNNSVTSTQVADARIEYVGNGYINEAQTMGWLQRFFLNVSPF